VGFIVWWLYEMFSRVALKVCARGKGQSGGVGVVKEAASHVGVAAASSVCDAAEDSYRGGDAVEGRAAVAVAAAVSVAASGVESDALSVTNPMYRRGGRVERGSDGKLAVPDMFAVGSGGDGDGSDTARLAESAVRPDATRRVSIVNPMHVRRHRTAAAAAGASATSLSLGAGADGSVRAGDVDALTMYFNSPRAAK
jgi:hypothetical protein